MACAVCDGNVCGENQISGEMLRMEVEELLKEEG
jgi:hypothetical protein